VLESVGNDPDIKSGQCRQGVSVGNRFVLMPCSWPDQMCTTHLPCYFFHPKIIFSFNGQMELHACKLL